MLCIWVILWLAFWIWNIKIWLYDFRTNKQFLQRIALIMEKKLHSKSSQALPLPSGITLNSPLCCLSLWNTRHWRPGSAPALHILIIMVLKFMLWLRSNMFSYLQVFILPLLVTIFFLTFHWNVSTSTIYPMSNLNRYLSHPIAIDI